MPKRGAQSRSTYLADRRWTEQEAGRALAAFEQSGMAIGVFAAREGLDPQRLARWRRRLAVAAEVPTFEEVTASVTRVPLGGDAAVAVEGAWFEIVFPSGRVVRVPASFETNALRRLLSVVDEVQGC